MLYSNTNKTTDYSDKLFIRNDGVRAVECTWEIQVVNELLNFQEPNEGQSGRRAGERLEQEL